MCLSLVVPHIKLVSARQGDNFSYCVCSIILTCELFCIISSFYYCVFFFNVKFLKKTYSEVIQFTNHKVNLIRSNSAIYYTHILLFKECLKFFKNIYYAIFNMFNLIICGICSLKQIHIYMCKVTKKYKKRILFESSFYRIYT